MNILIVDDHPLFRTALATVIERMESGAVIYEASTLQEVYEFLSEKKARLDLIVLDLDLSGSESTESIPEVQAVGEGVPIVVVSNYEDRSRIVRALELGARGYIPKSMSAELIQRSLELVLAGGLYAPTSIVESVVLGDDMTPVRKDIDLTDRQYEVLVELAAGKSNMEISRSLGIALGTVKLHVQAILTSLQAKNRTDAAMIANRRGLLPDSEVSRAQ